MKHASMMCLAALFLAACSNGDVPPEGSPAERLRTDRFGYKADPDVAVGQDNMLAWFKGVVSGASAPRGESPAKIGWLDTAKNCAFPEPVQGDRLVQVHTNESDQDSDIFALSKADVLERAQHYVAQWQQAGKDPGVNSNRSGDRLKVVDVVVTETQAPVYLVLAGGHDILWNVQKAENARISQVAIVGARNAGIVNIDAEVPVTVLAGNAAKTCKVAALRRPAAHWDVVERAEGGEQISREAVDSRKEAFFRYDRWFRANFGSDSESVTIGIDRMSHAFIGPAPASLEERIAYRGLAGSTVRLAPTDHAFFAPSAAEYDAMHGSLVKPKAAQLAGGELAMLNRN